MVYSSWEKEKSIREEKQRKHPKNPSFSSTLLDEIFNSIDGNEEKPLEVKRFTNQQTRKPNSDVGNAKMKATSNIRKVEEMASLKRACLMEKFMEKKFNEKISSLRNIPSLPELDNIRSLYDNDPMFFSTSSSSSSDSSSGGLSSSDAELFYSSSTKSRTIISCFSARSSSRNNNTNRQMSGNGMEDNLMKSKSRALKMYNNFKKVKQPISPGGRLTSFITSLFASGNVKRNKEEGKLSSSNALTCPSASSFSRSCITKSVPNSREGCDDFAVRKPVHFYPVNTHKSTYDEKFDRFKRQPESNENYGSATGSEPLKLHVLERNKNIDQEATRDVFRKGWKDKKKDDDFEDEDVERVSDSSSDLFEIDHLKVFGNNRFCEELPLYETTHLDRNRVIGSGLEV